MLKTNEIEHWSQYWRPLALTQNFRFALKQVCFFFALIWKRFALKEACKPKRYWSVFYPWIKWTWVLLWKYFGRYHEWGSSWNSFCSTGRLSFFHQNLKQKCLRHARLFSFVGKFTSGKNTFLLNLEKSNQHIEMKIKTWYWPLEEVSNPKLSPCLTCSVSRMKW